MEFTLTYHPPAVAACQPALPGPVRCSLAKHPTHGVALVTCFHSVAFMAHHCPCGTNHRAFVRLNGIDFEISVVALDQARDVAWFSRPDVLRSMDTHARSVATTLPNLGDPVVVFSEIGNIIHTVVCLPLRDNAPGSEQELQLQATPPFCYVPAAAGTVVTPQETFNTIPYLCFQPGQSGSPVVNAKNEVVGVVRNNMGRCGLVKP